MTDILANVVQTPKSTSAGPCELPILYRDASWFGMFFRVDLEKARALLADTSLEPMPLFGKAMATMHAWEYRDSTVGRYNELGLGIQVQQKGTKTKLLRYALDQRAQPNQAIWVVTLPVTTQSAYTAGVEIWGYPKYVSDIETRFSESETYVKLGNEVEMQLPRLLGPTTPSLPLVTYTSNKGRLVRTVIETQTSMRWGTGRRGKVRLLGDGPTSKALRALGLEEPTPVAAFQADQFRAVLPAGEEVGSAKA
jgi:hypothetical protein